MITVRIQKSPSEVEIFIKAMHSIGASYDKEDEDLDNIWYNVTHDDLDLLEDTINQITSAYTRY